jgi:hypothetical protein
MLEEDYAIALSNIDMRELKVGRKVLTTTILALIIDIDKTELKPFNMANLRKPQALFAP